MHYCQFIRKDDLSILLSSDTLIILNSLTSRLSRICYQRRHLVIARSSIHEEFRQEQIPDPKKDGRLKDIRVCKLCEFVFEHKTTSVLKTHLERKHTEAHKIELQVR